ncbi:hypothetical protein NEFER02_0431 [Nematocida sp. LUAm2]|nr:hypothetical protein NEFER02_0431 [Nematocida sp. LUAm2]
MQSSKKETDSLFFQDKRLPPTLPSTSKGHLVHSKPSTSIPSIPPHQKLLPAIPLSEETSLTIPLHKKSPPTATIANKPLPAIPITRKPLPNIPLSERQLPKEPSTCEEPLVVMRPDNLFHNPPLHSHCTFKQKQVAPANVSNANTNVLAAPPIPRHKNIPNTQSASHTNSDPRFAHFFGSRTFIDLSRQHEREDEIEYTTFKNLLFYEKIIQVFKYITIYGSILLFCILIINYGDAYTLSKNPHPRSFHYFLPVVLGLLVSMLVQPFIITKDMRIPTIGKHFLAIFIVMMVGVGLSVGKSRYELYRTILEHTIWISGIAGCAIGIIWILLLLFVHRHTFTWRTFRKFFVPICVIIMACLLIWISYNYVEYMEHTFPKDKGMFFGIYQKPIST